MYVSIFPANGRFQDNKHPADTADAAPGVVFKERSLKHSRNPHIKSF